MEVKIEDAVGLMVVIKNPTLFKETFYGIVQRASPLQTNTSQGHLVQLLEFPVMLRRDINAPPDLMVELADEETRKSKQPTKGCVFTYAPSLGNSVGSDPEVFVVNRKGNVFPAFKFLPAKANKGPESYAPYWDGFQAEFMTMPSRHGNSGCLSWLIDETQYGLSRVLTLAQQKNSQTMLTYKSVMDIHQRIMGTTPREFTTLGCAPSLNAYPNVMPLEIGDPANLLIRFAGCHFHYGWNVRNSVKSTLAPFVVRTIDAIVGPILTSMLQGMEDPRRRMYYGKAGEYRLPEHGLEYRVPSSGILAHPILFHIAYDIFRAAFHIGTLLLDHTGGIWQYNTDQIIDCINSYDVKSAQDILDANSLSFKTILARLYGNRSGDVNDVIRRGAMNIFDINNIVGNWKLRPSPDERIHKWMNHSEGPDCSVHTWHRVPEGGKTNEVEKTQLCPGRQL